MEYLVNFTKSKTELCELWLPGGASGQEAACQCRRPERQVPSLGQEDPLHGNPFQAHPPTAPGMATEPRRRVCDQERGRKKTLGK